MGKSGIITVGIFCVSLVSAVVLWTQSGRQEDSGLVNQTIDAGVALFNEKEYSEAITQFESVPPESEREWLARYYQGSAHIMLKDYQSAVTLLEQALALNPTNTRIMHALGVTYFKLGNLKISKAYFASILDLEPGNAEAKGLMDIMANLERQQPNHAERASQTENDMEKSNP